MDYTHKVLEYLNVWLVSVPLAGWYIAGSILGASGLLVGIVAWIKRRHLKKTMDKLEDWFINLNLWFWGSILTVGSFFVGVAAFGLTSGDFLPYLGTHAPQIIVFSTTIYTFSKGAKKWFEDRKKQKLLLSSQIPGIIASAAENIPKPPEPVKPVSADMWASDETLR